MEEEPARRTATDEVHPGLVVPIVVVDFPSAVAVENQFKVALVWMGVEAVVGKGAVFDFQVLVVLSGLVEKQNSGSVTTRNINVVGNAIPAVPLKIKALAVEQGSIPFGSCNDDILNRAGTGMLQHKRSGNMGG